MQPAQHDFFVGDAARWKADVRLLRGVKQKRDDCCHHVKTSALRYRASSEVSISRRQASERPPCVLGDHRVRRRGEISENRHNSSMLRRTRRDARVSECDASIADEPAPFRALDGTAAKIGTEFFLA